MKNSADFGRLKSLAKELEILVPVPKMRKKMGVFSLLFAAIFAEKSNNEAQQKLDENFVNEYGYSPLHYAALHGSQESCKVFLLKGANINLKSKLGITPIMLAFNRGHADVVKLLLQNGADATIRKSVSRRAADYAKPKYANVIRG